MAQDNGRHARIFFAFALIVFTCSFVSTAHATKLEVDENAPLWMHIAADVLLYGHIVGGTLGMISGAVALLTKKGGRLHILAGRVFFPSMFVTYAIGAGVAPFLPTEQRPNFIAGIMALYLLLSGWWAAKRRNPNIGWPEYAGLVTALIITAAGGLFIHMGANHPSGTVDGSPPQAFYLFVFAGSLATIGELNVILRRRIVGVSRIARHLWRMCFSLFIASGAFFFGQEQVLPEWLRGSIFITLLALAPLVAMIFWSIRVRFTKKAKS